MWVCVRGSLCPSVSALGDDRTNRLGLARTREREARNPNGESNDE